MKNAYNIFAGKSEGKRQLRRPRHKRQNDIKTDLKQGVRYGMDSSDSG
jgi:hypothetical protein